MIFWGEDFGTGPPATLELTALRDIYLALEENKGQPGQKHWQYVISQYFDNEHSGAVAAKVKLIFVKPSSLGGLTNEAVEAEIREMVEVERGKGINPTPESQYVVIPQPGTNYSNIPEVGCGFHSVTTLNGIENLSYSLIPCAEDVGCLANEEATVTHEYA